MTPREGNTFLFHSNSLVSVSFLELQRIKDTIRFASGHIFSISPPFHFQTISVLLSIVVMKKNIALVTSGSLQGHCWYVACQTSVFQEIFQDHEPEDLTQITVSQLGRFIAESNFPWWPQEGAPIDALDPG